MPATDTVKVTSPDFVDDAVMSELVGNVDSGPRTDSGCERVCVSSTHLPFSHPGGLKTVCSADDTTRVRVSRGSLFDISTRSAYLGIHIEPIKSHSHVQTHTELCVYGHEELATVQALSESFTSAGVRSDLPAASL